MKPPGAAAAATAGEEGAAAVAGGSEQQQQQQRQCQPGSSSSSYAGVLSDGVYDLVAVLIHKGTSASHGHYGKHVIVEWHGLLARRAWDDIRISKPHQSRAMVQEHH
jgi:hypothetical protein